MNIHRTIFRLDFNLNFRVIDTPGKTMEMIAVLGDQFWDGVGDSTKSRSVVGKFVDPKGRSYREFSLQPQALVFSLESASPIELGNGPGESDLNKLADLTDQLTEAYGIQSVARAGLRQWHLGFMADGAPQLPSFMRAIDPRLADSISGAGPVQDIGLTFQGAADDRYKYRISCSPVSREEIASKKEYFPNTKDAISQQTDANIIFDVDLYEESFSFKGRRPSAWLARQWARGRESVEKVARTIEVLK